MGKVAWSSTGAAIAGRRVSGTRVVLLDPEQLVAGVVLGCEIGDLLIPEPGKVHRPGQAEETERAAVGAGTLAPKVIPKRRDGRPLPPQCTDGTVPEGPRQAHRHLQ